MGSVQPPPPPPSPEPEIPRWLWFLLVYVLAITPIRSCTALRNFDPLNPNLKGVISFTYFPLLLMAGLLHRRRISRLLSNGFALGAVLALTWIYFAGSYNYLADAARLSVCLAVAALVAHFAPWSKPFVRSPNFIKPWPEPLFGALFMVLFLVPAWIWTSLADRQYTTSAVAGKAPDAGRYETVWPKPPWPNVKIALALSGGGYRAALMHAGVLDILDRMSVKITYINAVSGGAIIAAYYAAGGQPENFRDLIGSRHVSLLRTLIDLPNPLCILFPFPLPGTEFSIPSFYECDRLDVQANLLDSLLQLNGLTLAELASVTASPRLMLSATDLNSGDAIGFTADGLIREQLRRPWEHHETVGGSFRWPFRPKVSPGDERLTRLVATSGAFPFAFAPNVVESMSNDETLRLADGGLVDNTGVLLLRAAQNDKKNPWDFDLIIVSDASAVFSSDDTSGSVLRAADVVYARLASSDVLHSDDVVYFSADDAALVGYDPRSDDRQTALRQLFVEARDVVPLLIGETCEGAPEQVPFERCVTEHVLGFKRPGMDYELGKALRTFGKTGTLDDQITKKHARQLFRLGQYLMAMKWKELTSKAATIAQSQ